MNIENLIQKSIIGTISRYELGLLKQALLDQPELRELLSIEHAMYLYRNQRLKAELRNSLVPPPSKNIFKKFLALVLLLLGLIVGGYWIYQTKVSKPSVTHFAETYLNEKIVSPAKLMGGPVTDKNLWSDAVDKYGNSDYNQALKLINQIEEPSSEQSLYKGLCHVYKIKPNYIAASQILNSLQKSKDDIVYDQALWYGALVDIKLGQMNKAKSQLAKIIEGDLWKAKEAKGLLEILKK